jgi:hypothetical protein
MTGHNVAKLRVDALHFRFDYIHQLLDRGSALLERGLLGGF